MFVRSPRDKTALALDLGIALLPASAWAIFLYGGRAAVLMIFCGLCCTILDFPVQKWICRAPLKDALSPYLLRAGNRDRFPACFCAGRTAPLFRLPGPPGQAGRGMHRMDGTTPIL